MPCRRPIPCVRSPALHAEHLVVEHALTQGVIVATQRVDQRVGAAMISVCMVANTVGKIVMGWLTDHIGARTSIMAYTVAVCASIVALFVVHVPAAFIVASFFFGLCYSRATVGLSMMCREVFGKRGFGVVYPVAALGCSFSNAVFSSAVGYGYDLTGGYAVSLVAFLVFLAGSSAVVLWCYGRAGERSA